MKIKTRERAIRTIISSFLQSDLTAKEINEISDAFTYDNDFVQDITKVLCQISDVINNKSLKQQSITYEFEDEVIEKALEIIKRKRLSKKMIISEINKINPGISKTLVPKSKNMTIKNMLSQFLNLADLTDFTQFVNLLEGQNIPGDKYLEGILDR